MIREDPLGIFDDHPAYGLLDIARTTSNGTILVDSAIKHHSTIKIRIKRARRNRKFNRDSYFDDSNLIEIELSPVQFAEAITSMNTRGVPCTLRWIAGEGYVPEPVLDHARERVVKEFKDDIAHIHKELDEAKTFVDNLLTQKTVSKGDVKRLHEMLTQAKQDIQCDLPFVAKQFNETVEKTIASAKGEFEAYVLHRALEIGSRGLVENTQGIEVNPPELQLEGPTNDEQ